MNPRPHSFLRRCRRVRCSCSGRRALEPDAAPAPSLTLLSRDGRRAAADHDGRRSGVRRARRSRRAVPADGPRRSARRDHRFLQRENDCPDAGSGAGLGRRAGSCRCRRRRRAAGGAGSCRWNSSAARCRSSTTRGSICASRRACWSSATCACRGSRSATIRSAPSARLTIDATPRAHATVTQEAEHLTIKFDADALDVANPPLPAPSSTGLCCRPCAWSMRRRSRSISVRASPASGPPASRSTRRRAWSSICSPQPDRAAAGSAGAAPGAPPPASRRRRTLPPRFGQSVVGDPHHRDRSRPRRRGRRRQGRERREGKGSDAGDRAPRQGRDRSAARPPRAADPRRRSQRADRRAHGDREQQQGGPVHQPARQRVAAAERPAARRSSPPRSSASGRQARPPAAPTACPTFGGGSRDIELVLWDLAQTRHLDRSATFAGMLEQQLRERVPLAAQAVDRAPLRVLESANMPAVLIEIGYLTNPEQEKLLDGRRVPERRRPVASTTRSSGSATRSSAGGTQ